MGKILIGKDAESIKDSSIKKENQFETLFNKIKDIENLLTVSDKNESTYDVDFNSLLKTQDLNYLQENVTNIDKKINVLEKTDSKIKLILESIERSAIDSNELKELVNILSKHIDQIQANQISANNITKQESTTRFQALESALIKLLNEINLINLKIDEQNSNDKTKDLLSNLKRIEEKTNNNGVELTGILQNILNEIKNIKANQNKTIEDNIIKQKRLEFGFKICIALNVVSIFVACFL